MENPDISLNSVFYPLDVREMDPTQCVRIWSNGFLKDIGTSLLGRTEQGLTRAAGTGNTVVLMPATATQQRYAIPSRVNSNDSVSDGFVRLTMQNTYTGAASTELCRSWITTFSTTENPSGICGDYEIDLVARVRVNFNGEETTNTTARFGCIPRHAPYVLNTDQLVNGNAACFLASRLSGNWTVRVGRIVTDESVLDQYITTYSTSYSYSDWRTLRVWISPYGEVAKFYIDGQLVHTITDKKFMPIDPYSASNYGMMFGSFFRKDDQYTTSNHPHFDIDWMVIKLFMNRTGLSKTEDITPAAVDWPNIGYQAGNQQYTYSEKQITGIDRPIRIKFSHQNIGDGGLYVKVSDSPVIPNNQSTMTSGESPQAKGFIQFFSGDTIVVENNKYLCFGYSGSAASTFTVTVTNYSTNTVIDTFDCVIS